MTLNPQLKESRDTSSSKLLATLDKCTVASVFFICDYANLCCTWYIALVDMYILHLCI